MNRQTKSEKIFSIVNNVLMFVFIIIMLYPIVNQIAVSFSSDSAIMSGMVTVWPVRFTTIAYRDVLFDKNFLNAMKNTALFTVFCTFIQMMLTMLFAYPLSKKNLKGRSPIMTVLVFSMMFGTGGLIPNYLLIQNMGLINSYWSLILPGAISIWNVIIFKNFFQQLPESLEEAAQVDGAGVWRVFFQIVIPLSKPVIAALTLFTAISAWSTFFNALIYITDTDKKLLQVYLNDILQANIVPQGQQMSDAAMAADAEKVNSDALKAASLICTMLPVTLIYPFVQKYFMAGLMIGSVKG